MNNIQYPNPMTINTKYLLAAGILIGSLMISGAVLAQAQIPNGPSEEEIAAKGIVFPVPELGNCGSKEECKSYCDDTANIETCVSFAEKHGLMNPDEAAKAKKFGARIKSGGGPGGCKTPKECESICSNLDNIETCVKFAEDNGISDRHVEDGKKMLQFMKSGGQTPGGCRSREQCDSYCGNFDHMEECVAFSEKTGLQPPEEEGGPPPGDLKKFLEVVKNGETPGGCRSREACDAYCHEEANREECISFAEKAGFMPPEQAEKIRRIGRNGPGGCSSRETCEQYCSAPENQEMCFKFAEENGLIDEGELKNAKEGFVRLRQGLENAPPEVKECLTTTLGQNIIENIQTGKLTPGSEIGERVRACFEKFGGGHDPAEAFKNAPPEVESCLKEKLGEDFDGIKNGTSMPTPEMGDVFRVCFQQVRILGGEGGEDRGDRGPDMPPRGLGDFIRSAPPQVAECLKSKLGDDFEGVQTGEAGSVEDVHDKVRSCFEEFRPEMRPQNVEERREGEFRQPQEGVTPRNADDQTPQVVPGAANFPPAVIECAKRNLPEDKAIQLVGGGEISPETAEIIKRCFAEIMRERALQQQPSVEFRPPEGQFIPPPSDMQTAPPQETIQIRPEGEHLEPPPTSFRSRYHIGNLILPILNLLR